MLAERCAYLVSDAPPTYRCNVDELLVLTFTDAAAAEMRGRIVEAIRARALEHPHDRRLREQVALVEAAQISTIHSFCHGLIRRWFSELRIDPTATLLDAEEATLLRGEVLDELLTELYAPTMTPDHPLGEVPGEEAVEPGPIANTGLPGETLAPEFVRLVEVYGLGDDRDIAALILKLDDFVTSLPDPDGWLRRAADSVAHAPGRVVLGMFAGLGTEVRRQLHHCAATAAALEAGDSVGHFYAAQIRAYGDHLREWADLLSAVETDRSVKEFTDEEVDRVLAVYDSVRQRIAEHQFSKGRPPRLSKDGDPAVAEARDLASARLSELKRRFFGDRLRKRFALFSVEELIAGLAETAPFISTIVETVTAFRKTYAARKRRLDVLDFSDLERFAFDLLRADADSPQPSDAARTLHRRFAHVLVDEFQDINPLQQAIIRLVSRESDPDRTDNLFVVGDVKQSIYRFRLAEPKIFTERLHAFHGGADEGEAIALQASFRSRSEIIETVNLIFRRLMSPGTGDLVYDQEAELHPGREADQKDPGHPVELHLLERSLDAGVSEDAVPERGIADLNEPARWAAIEREAYLIGSLIRDWREAGRSTPPGQSPAFRDIAVLLRATKVNAERMAVILTSLGIPAYADVGGSLFGAREIRDVLAALQILDNPQQDIPLAAVLRSGILAEPLSEDDLVDIRCLDRDIPFHEAVRRYAEQEPPNDLVDRLQTILHRIQRYRDEVRRRPLATALGKLYEEQGYLAYAGGMPNGVQRRANLLKLHELARRFGSFRRQGLHRFLRFVASLEDEDRAIATAPAIGESDDVVRIMSIHQSKGLEFPVVFVAGLGTKFNLGDRSGRMIFERAAGIGLRVVDRRRMIEYASAAHTRVAAEVEQQTREEELRILYVAMTRAREKLILVGSMRNLDRCGELARASKARQGPSGFEVATAATPLDWLIPALASAPPEVVRGFDGASPEHPLVEVVWHDSVEMAGWRVEKLTDASEAATHRAAARGEALPPTEPAKVDDPEIERILARIDYIYPFLPSGAVRAAVAASEFKGTLDFTQDPEQQGVFTPDTEAFEFPASGSTRGPRDAAIRRGVITHRVFQHLDFAAASGPSGVASELQRLEAEGVITRDERSLVDAAGIEWFVSVPLGTAIRRAGAAYRREFQYIATEPAAYFDRSLDPASGDDALVRGIVDGILPTGDGIEIVDFKTDAIRPEDVPVRAERYRPQMELYARAMSRLWGQPVRAGWLVFIGARELVELRDLTGD